jgi:arginine exporter protein ArgO
LRIFGLFMLSILGWKALCSRPAERSAQVERSSSRLGAFYASTFALTLTNPLTILSFLGIFAGLGAGERSASSWVLVLGVFCGSALWWLLLALGVSLLRERITPAALLWVNRSSGLILLGFAVSIALGLFSG